MCLFVSLFVHLPVEAMQLVFMGSLATKDSGTHPVATALLWFMAFYGFSQRQQTLVCLFVPLPLQCIASSGREKHVELLVSQSVLGQQLTQPFSKTPPAPSHPPAALPCALKWGVMKENFVVEYVLQFFDQMLLFPHQKHRERGRNIEKLTQPFSQAAAATSQAAAAPS